jgi:hypothetical protein
MRPGADRFFSFGPCSIGAERILARASPAPDSTFPSADSADMGRRGLVALSLISGTDHEGNRWRMRATLGPPAKRTRPSAGLALLHMTWATAARVLR